MREYGKIYTQFWTSPDIVALSDTGKLLATYLLSCPHTSMIGCFRLPPAYICADLRWDGPTGSKGLGELSEKGFLTYDEDCVGSSSTSFSGGIRSKTPIKAKLPKS